MGDADITLRHISRRHAEALARLYVPEGSLEIVAWADTQVTALERRLDKTLLLRLAGELHALEVEFAYRYELDLPDRIHEYQSLSRIAFRDERPGERPPPMESVIILLTGRRRRWPAERALRTGWKSRRWSGTRFQIDPVYQRTMMADVDPWGHTLRPEIEAMIQHQSTDLIQVSKTLRDAYDRGQREGIEKGIEKGVQQMLHGLFARRLHRALTAREQEALAARAVIDPEQIQDKALALEGESLAAWLLAPEAR